MSKYQTILDYINHIEVRQVGAWGETHSSTYTIFTLVVYSYIYIWNSLTRHKSQHRHLFDFRQLATIFWSSLNINWGTSQTGGVIVCDHSDGKSVLPRCVCLNKLLSASFPMLCFIYNSIEAPNYIHDSFRTFDILCTEFEKLNYS